MAYLGCNGVIGTRNEKSLHASLKEYYERPGDLVEANIDGYIIDLVQTDRLVEIQTSNFGAIKGKLSALLENHQVLVAHPIAMERELVQVAPETGELLGTRKSPKKGTVYDLFTELVRIPHLLLHPNLTIEAVLVRDQEIRCPDGKGSWRRRGVSIVDRLLIEVVKVQTFSTPEDYLELLPAELVCPFSNKELALEAKIPVNLARRVNYTLKKAGLITEVGKRGNEILHERVPIKKLSTVYTGYPQDTA